MKYALNYITIKNFVYKIESFSEMKKQMNSNALHLVQKEIKKYDSFESFNVKFVC